MDKLMTTVKLENVDLVVHACTDPLDLRRRIRSAWAVVEVFVDDVTHVEDVVRIEGKPVTKEEFTNLKALRNSKLEIMNDGGRITYYDREGGRICHAFTDGEYAYEVCISMDVIAHLVMLDMMSWWFGG